MSGMDERAKQFRTVAESQPKGDALAKEINTLRRFLFRNQEYRFTKSAQISLYTAILAHHSNAEALASAKQEAPIIALLDDALKMPFTVFTSPQKDKLLALYWGVLGEAGERDKPNAGVPSAPQSKRRALVLMDIEQGEPPLLVLMHDDGTEYDFSPPAPPGDVAAIQEAFDSGKEVRIVVQEALDGGVPTVVDVDVVDEAS